MENHRFRDLDAPGTPELMKLFRFYYSPYARKVQMLLDLMGAKYELVEVKYSDRRELARVTGGYVHVPVLVDDDGGVTVESRDICERLLTGDAKRRLVPAPLDGPIWAYADFCDGLLEDTLFRIGSPVIRDRWEDPGERALYVLIKERKFGAGCVDQWEKQRDQLFERGRHLIGPSVATLERGPFVFGAEPTMADAALYGNLAMLHVADPSFVERLSPILPDYMRRLEAVAAVASA